MCDDLEHVIGRDFEAMSPSRRKFLLDSFKFCGALSLGIFMPSHAYATLNISNDFSPRNKERSTRSHSEYIILHTTEANDISSLNMVKRYGLANYLVHTDGSVKRIIDKSRLAKHVGRSMWGGRPNLDDWSIGIEVVGFHDKPLRNAQYESLKELLNQLQNIYGIPDEDVIPHSMVAYGKPNRWHNYNHRGRKRCGMFFADPNVRKKLGLTKAPSYDPDVSAGRLRVADADLNEILFGQGITNQTLESVDVGSVISKDVSAWAIARAQYNAPTTRYTFPDGSVSFGDEIKNWGSLPSGTKVDLDVNGIAFDNIEYFQKIVGGDTAWSVAGKEFNASTTIYFLPSGIVRRGDELSEDFLNNIPRGTEVLTGYVYGGKITAQRSALSIAGNKWADNNTFYRLDDGEIISGDNVDQSKIPEGTFIFFRSNNY